MSLPPVRFVTTSDGVRLAYAVYGSGPPLVWVANWLTHLELDWASPVWKHWVEFFTRHHTLIRYDQRGCGLSDWTDEGLDLDHWVGDLTAIVDALAVERFDLLGLSQGGPVAVEYAVRNPQRVRHLVLFGTFASGRFLAQESVIAAQTETMAQLIESGWGASNPAFRQLFTSLFVPGATDEQREWFNQLQAKSTTPRIAAALLRAFHRLDVSHRLAEVRSPTLVLHPRRDAAIPFEEGRAMAAGIPDARFVPLDSDNHIPLEHNAGWPVFCREFAAFTGAQQHPPAESRKAAADARPATGGYAFDDFTVNLRSREILHAGRSVPVEHRAFELLAYLIEHRDRAVAKDELQTAVWPSMILSESALTRCVMKARRAVGDDADRQRVIRTVHGYGYRFVADLHAVPPAR